MGNFIVVSIFAKLSNPEQTFVEANQTVVSRGWICTFFNFFFFCIIVYKKNGLKYFNIKKNSDFCFSELFLVEQVIIYLYHPSQNWDKF